GLTSGTFNMTLALILGQHLPQVTTICGAALLGVFSYGFSLTFFIMAMKQLGAARATAYVATEPFIGAVLSVFLLGDPVNLNLVLSAIFMALGVWLHLTEKPVLEGEQATIAFVAAVSQEHD